MKQPVRLPRRTPSKTRHLVAPSLTGTRDCTSIMLKRNGFCVDGAKPTDSEGWRVSAGRAEPFVRGGSEIVASQDGQLAWPDPLFVRGDDQADPASRRHEDRLDV